MNERTDLDRLLTAWLAADAPVREPEPLLDRVLARTARTRRRPAWRVPERWFPVSTITTRLASTSRIPVRGLAVAALLILAITVALFVAGSRPQRLAPPFGPAHNGRIVFADHGDILAVDSPTGKPTVVIGGPAQDGFPWFSPNGARFAFLRGDPNGDAELWVADSDGGHPMRLAAVTKFEWAEWSPESDVLAVTSDADRSVMTMVRADGAGSTTLHTGLAVVESPVWRPGGSGQMAFRGQAVDGTMGIYFMDRTASSPVRLDLDPGFKTDDYYSENFEYYFLFPAWSPDGSRLMYHTLEPAPESPAGPGFRIHIADIDTGGRIATERLLEFNHETDDEYEAQWLPTGDSFVYQTIEGLEHRLAIGYADGTKPARDLGFSAQDAIGFQLSPDGRQILTAVKPVSTADAEVTVVDVDTGKTTPVTITEDLAWQRTAP